MQRPAQLSHAQQLLVAQGSQNFPGVRQVLSGWHASSQKLVKKLQACPSGQASSSSQRPTGVGTQAARQSAHAGQLELAHPSQTRPPPQLSHEAPEHAGAHSPVLKTHRSSTPQSSCVEQKNAPVEAETETVSGKDPPAVAAEAWLAGDEPVETAAPVRELVEPLPPFPAPPFPLPPSSSNTTVPPQAATPQTAERTKTAE